MPVLRLVDLEKRYDTGDHALRGVSLSVDEGEVVAVIGASGAGKSTLIRCVNRLVEPTAGRVFLRDSELTGMGRAALRRERARMGMIFQAFALVDRLTVMENVLSGALARTGFLASVRRRFSPDDIEHAFELLERVDLAGMENKRADALSGGQRQRVGLARALMQRPDWLLVGEPTASLDPKTSRAVMELLRELVRERGLTALVNLHDVPLARSFASRVVALREGEVVFDDHPGRLEAEELGRIYEMEAESFAS